MVNRLLNIGNILILGIAVVMTLILPYKLIYLSKTAAIFTLILALFILIVLTVKNRVKVQIRLSLLSIILLFIFVMDNGFFYRVNADIVYQDQDVFIVDKNEPTAIMSCGTVYTLFVEKYWGFKGYEVIPNKYCFTELPEIELDDEKKDYTFLLEPNGYVYGKIEFYLESEEIVFNIKSVRNADSSYISKEDNLENKSQNISSLHCFERFLGHEFLELTDSFSIQTENGGFIIYEVVDSLLYTRKYKSSLEGCTIFLDTGYCSGYRGFGGFGKKMFDLMWENDSVCYFSYSAGSGLSADFLINKINCNKSIFGYTILPNGRGEYLLILDKDTIVKNIW